MKAFLVAMAFALLLAACSRDEPAEVYRIVRPQPIYYTNASNVVMTLNNPVHTNVGLRLVTISNSVAIFEYTPTGALQTADAGSPLFTNHFGRFGLILSAVNATNEEVVLTRHWSEVRYQ